MSKLKAIKPELADPGHLKGVLFGKSGAGKTWTALSFPEPYFIDTEGGARLSHYTQKLSESGGSYFGVDQGSQDFNTVIEQVQALATEKHHYKSLVIDSITKIYQLEIAREADRLGSKDAFGASKKPAVAYMRRLINWISRLDMNVWLIAHESSEWGIDATGQRTEIGKMPDIFDKLIYELDLTLQVRMYNAKRRDALVYKTRLLGFPANEQIILQDNGTDVSYAAITDRYGRDFIERTPQQITLASAEQSLIINTLFERLQFTDEQIAKGLSKRGVDSIEELSSDQAESLILDLKKRTVI